MGRGTLSVESIFYCAIEIDTPAERAAYLDEACRHEAELRHEVERLLNAHFKSGSFLDGPSPALEATAAMPAVSEASGTQIGPYKLLEQIGEGGFGVVFMALQERPVRRRVALKVIKPGMDTSQVIARFEAERQALALMDHPNIARVFDAGATQTGRPYFVMELVPGLPLTEYCDQHQLTPRERLELFVTVCHAVQHAHQKGIIHRDIKPTNVLVTLHDDKPVVKVIDFGVAKATVGQLTDKTLFTGFAQMVGTPLYMSPEQAQMSGLDVDTRSDIYSLGVLLYELLTGTTPFNRRRLQEAAYDEIRRIIREEEPQKPSTRLSSLGQGGMRNSHSGGQSPPDKSCLASIAARRNTEPRKLSRLLRGELDWIVMKALEKDRNRRYETASDFASDVRHYLANEPVSAWPPSTCYRFRKLASRNKGLFAAATASFLVILLGLVTLAVSNSLIRQEQARTRGEKDRADQARLLAEERAAEIRQGLERLKAGNRWLERGRWYSDLQHWNDADAALTKAVELRPDHAPAWVERGDFFAQLGLWDLASDNFAHAFELHEPDTTMRWFRNALLRLSLGDAEGYEQIRHRMRERFRGTRDSHFASEVVRTSVLGTGPVDVERLVEVAQQMVDARPESWYELYVLGIAQYRAGRFEQAALRLRESLTAGPDWPGRRLSYPVLAMAHWQRGDLTAARESLQCAADAIDDWTRQMYEGQSERGWVINQGAGAVWPIAWWDWLECQLYYREAKLMIDGSPPPEDPRLHVLHARAFAGLHRNFSADIEYAAILQQLPNDPQFRLEAHRCAGYSAVERGEWRTAAAEFGSACDLRTDDSYLWRMRSVACLAAGDLDGYRQACIAMLERFERTDDPQTAGNVLLVCTLRDDALSDMSRLLPLTGVADRLWHWGAWARGAALYRAGKYKESVRSFGMEANMYRPTAWDWCFLAMGHHRLGNVDEARRCAAEARDWIIAANRKQIKDLSVTEAQWGAWHESVVFPLLLREAEDLLNTESAITGQDRAL